MGQTILLFDNEEINGDHTNEQEKDDSEQGGHGTAFFLGLAGAKGAGLHVEAGFGGGSGKNSVSGGIGGAGGRGEIGSVR